MNEYDVIDLAAVTSGRSPEVGLRHPSLELWSVEWR